MNFRPAVESLEVRALPAADFRTLPILPFGNPAVLDHARAIVAHGQDLGRRLDALVKFGDSNTSRETLADSAFLAPLGLKTFNLFSSGLAFYYPQLLGAWASYQSTVEGANSFTLLSPGAQPGWHLANVIAALPSQIAATDAGLAFIMIGTNDVLTGTDPSEFQSQLALAVQELTGAGVLPVLSTIPDMQGDYDYLSSRVVEFNQIIADVAEANRVPLWNTWQAMAFLPGGGLDRYGVHLNASPNGGGSFMPADLLFGQNVRNLEALQILDWFRETIVAGQTFIPPWSKWNSMPDSGHFYSVSRDVGFSPTVDVYDADSGARVNRFLAFDPAFAGGVRVATGDVNGDGYTDIVCATGEGTMARVRVFSGKDGSMLVNRVPFRASYQGGLSVAIGELDGDTVADIVVAKLTGKSAVAVYHGSDFALLARFRPFPGMRGGASVAVANAAGIGPVIAAGSSIHPLVRLFDATGTLLTSFAAFGQDGFGIVIAAGDLTDDGSDELAVTRLDASDRVRIMNLQTHTVDTTLMLPPPVDPSFGVRLGSVRLPGGKDLILVGNAPGSPVCVRVIDDLAGNFSKLSPANGQRSYGIFVG